MNTSKIAALIMLVCAFAGCKKDTPVNPSSANMPVIANTQNAFAFNLVASSYTSSSAYSLSFSTDSLVCSLTITGQTIGKGSLKIIDANSSTVYEDSTLSNKVVAITQTGKGIPKNITMVFNNYSGTVSFALARMYGH